MFTRLSRMGLAAALGAGLLVGAGASVPAQAKTVKACVKKTNGKVKILTTKKKQKKKCKKGWKKVSWNQTGSTGPQGPTGPTGPTGAQGPSQYVKDGTGKVLGKYLGLYPVGLNLISVLIDGGAYLYTPDGKTLSVTTPVFKTNTCSGTGYMTSTSAQTTAIYIGSAGGPSRVLYRKTDPTFGPATAYAFTQTTEVVNQTMYRWDSAGVCVSNGNHNGTIVALQQVTAPPDVPGPLTID